jgi:hypothetical protein
MIFLPEFQVTASSNIKDAICKTFKVTTADNTFTSTSSGVNVVKAVLPADATLLDVNVWTATGSNATTTANLYVGAVLPFTSITSTTTTATVTTPILHGLATGDTIVVNGTGQANFDKATPVSITVTTTTAFTYTITSTAATSTIGNIGVTSYFIKPPLSVLNNLQVSITPGASPYAWTSPAIGNLVISGGTVSAVTLTHAAGTPVAIPTAGIVPVMTGDVVTVTYTGAPTMTFIPHDKSATGILQSIATHVGPPAIGWYPVGGSGTPQGTDIQVFGLYQETGTASTLGGPWYVTLWYVR